MTTSNATSTAYAFRIHGNPATPAAKAKALAGTGQLLIAKDHKLAAFLPDALDATSKVPDVLVRTAEGDSTRPSPDGSNIFDDGLKPPESHPWQNGWD